jgi:hypothetical protein
MALNTALLGFLTEIIIKQTFVVDGIISLGKVFNVKIDGIGGYYFEYKSGNI